MSNFICSECGMTNIDCGRAGYKTPKEIELEKKLEIATKALKVYANTNTWCLCNKLDCSYVDGSVACIALKEMEGVK